MSYIDDLRRLYDILAELESQVGGRRILASCSGRQLWPHRGVYFVFEEEEFRTVSGSGGRVVRVGTHAVSAGSKSTLWGRLSAHRGAAFGGGNHRGSVFRSLVGEALVGRNGLDCPSWPWGGSLRHAAEILSTSGQAVRSAERAIERAVSLHIGRMSVLSLELDDEPGPDSWPGYIERNCIGLLSAAGRPEADLASAGWLGLHSLREKVRASGLWNQNHVQPIYRRQFLDVLTGFVRTKRT